MSDVAPSGGATALAPSARAALRWARASAVSRNGLALPPVEGVSVSAVLSDALVDSLDLLAGLTLSDPVDSPVRLLLDRLDIHPARVFGERRLDVEELSGIYAYIPADDEPELAPDARLVVDGAASGGPFEGNQFATADALLLSLLRLPTVPASQRLAVALRDAGHDYAALTGVITEFVSRFADSNPDDPGAGWREVAARAPRRHADSASTTFRP